MQKTLDLSIKKHETGTTDGGYCIADRKSYSSYMSNQNWEEFQNDMIQNHKKTYAEYGAGSGGEMKQKGCYPPKMASYGSSSRMIYNLCKDIQSFYFEYQLPTKVGGVANLDGFMEKENELIFVEAKCREPYGVKVNLIENKYKKLYEYIDKDVSSNLTIQIKDTENKMDVTFLVDDCKISCFDIKQMISHLLGIAVKLLNSPTRKNISFVYLCYNPYLIEIVNTKKKDNILSTYKKMCSECNAIDFAKLFEVILRYLNQELNVGNATEEEIGKIVSNFSFALCDQGDYTNYIK